MVLISQTQFRAAGQASRQCTSPDTEESPLGSFQVEPNTPGELTRMRQDPHGAFRPRKHLLVVHWRAGARRFGDRSPYMQGTLDGLYWTYCGFISEAGVHLVQRNDLDGLSGILVDDKTGAILPAGFSVTFSPDSKRYVALINNDGDFEVVKLFDRSGKLLWQGENGLLSADGQSVISEYLALHWDAAGTLLAEYKDDKGFKHTLTPEKAGETQGKWVPVPSH
jgi:hypothetical protein